MDSPDDIHDGIYLPGQDIEVLSQRAMKRSPEKWRQAKEIARDLPAIFLNESDHDRRAYAVYLRLIDSSQEEALTDDDGDVF
jgi:hypothetical protein